MSTSFHEAQEFSQITLASFKDPDVLLTLVFGEIASWMIASWKNSHTISIFDEENYELEQFVWRWWEWIDLVCIAKLIKYQIKKQDFTYSNWIVMKPNISQEDKSEKATM